MTSHGHVRIPVDESSDLTSLSSDVSLEYLSEYLSEYSSEYTSEYSYDNYNIDISPLSSGNSSPSQRNIPIASHITNVVSNAVPFLNNNNEDNWSLPTSVSSNSDIHSINSLYFQRKYNSSCCCIFLFNSVIFFLFAVIDKNTVTDINPKYEQLYFYAISVYPYCTDHRNEIWRLFTYSFVHNGLGHLFGNMATLYMSTLILYKYQSIYRILFLYILTIINGAFSFYLTNPYRALIGASGGIYGLIGSMISNHILNVDNMYPEERLANFFIVGLFFILDIIFYTHMRDDNIAYQVHWYSFLFGILIGFITYEVKHKKKYKTFLRFLSIVIFCYLNSFLIYNYSFNFPPEYSFSYFKISKERNCCIESYYINNTNICDS